MEARFGDGAHHIYAECYGFTGIGEEDFGVGFE
jgi:hypothetical protein